MAVPFTSRLKVAPDVLFSELGGESVLLDMKTERYLGIDEVGTRMWHLLTTCDSIQSAGDRLLREYEVQPDRLRQDLSDFVDKLLDLGLVEFDGDSPRL